MPAKLDNSEVARALVELARCLDGPQCLFKARALNSAARTIADLRRPVAEMWMRCGFGSLTALPWVGPCIASWIVELVTSGRIAELDRLRRAARQRVD